MRPIRQRSASKPAVEQVEEAESPKGGSTVLVASMVGLLVLSFLCLGAALAVEVLPDSRFHFNPPWFEHAFEGFMGLSTIFAAACVLLKGVITMTRK